MKNGSTCKSFEKITNIVLNKFYTENTYSAVNEISHHSKNIIKETDVNEMCKSTNKH